MRQELEIWVRSKRTDGPTWTSTPGLSPEVPLHLRATSPEPIEQAHPARHSRASRVLCPGRDSQRPCLAGGRRLPARPPGLSEVTGCFRGVVGMIHRD